MNRDFNKKVKKKNNWDLDKDVQPKKVFKKEKHHPKKLREKDVFTDEDED